MHVIARSGISPETVWARIESACLKPDESASRRHLIREPQSQPPKLALTGTAITFFPSAEVAVNATKAGSEVVLRLMWGPLPAPFPRVMAALGLAVGIATATLSGGDASELLVALLIVLLPGVALIHQRHGEREIQSRLSALLDNIRFEPKPH
jgi:hypothetical protein